MIEKYHVLVVEDDKEIRDGIEIYLKSQGYEVYKALRPSVALWPTPQWLWDNDNGGGSGSGIWLTQETKNWMVRLGVNANYCIKDGDQVIE